MVGNAGPEGKQEDSERRRLWLMNADGSGKRQLTHNDMYRDEHPMWSRDSRYILFLRFDAQHRGSVWSVDIASGKTAKLVANFDSFGAPAYYGHLNWSFFLAWNRN